MPPSSPLPRLRRLCLAYPDAHEVEAWGEPTFRVRNKLFVMFASPNTHHGNGRAAVWCKATRENQAWMVQSAPDRYFVPPYVGVNGWIGVYLDRETDWEELARIVTDSYRAVAPKRLVAVLDAATASEGPDGPTSTPARRSRKSIVKD
jgi:hypothetical protein